MDFKNWKINNKLVFAIYVAALLGLIGNIVGLVGYFFDKDRTLYGFSSVIEYHKIIGESITMLLAPFIIFALYKKNTILISVHILFMSAYLIFHIFSYITVLKFVFVGGSFYYLRGSLIPLSITFIILLLNFILTLTYVIKRFIKWLRKSKPDKKRGIVKEVTVTVEEKAQVQDDQVQVPKVEVGANGVGNGEAHINVNFENTE